ncbi:MAG: hypothetical protein MUF83_02620 [Acidimicrobiales bacterium]|jgi:hypothetical protein|nr:hypothetical protein [Acidimicrobiales bacterium]
MTDLRARGAALVADLRVVAPAWVAARLLLVLAALVADAVARNAVPGGSPAPLREGLLAWDGGWYRSLATVGYAGSAEEALRFFPLFPSSARVLDPILPAGAALALVVVANLASLAAAVLLRRLALFETDDPALADRAAWLVCLTPASFVLAWGYAEPLFLALSIGAFLAVRRGQWWWAAPLGALAALTRPLGVVLALPLAYEALRTWRHTDGSGRVARVGATLAPVAGLAAFLGWVGVVYDDPLLPFTVQGELRGGQDPITRLWQGLGDLVGAERFGDGLHIPFAVAFVALLVVVARRWPAAYALYAGAVLVAALAADNLNSLERYGLNAFPLVLAVASLTASTRVERAVLAVCGCGLFALAALAWLDVYVP